MYVLLFYIDDNKPNVNKLVNLLEPLEAYRHWKRTAYCVLVDKCQVKREQYL